MADHDRLVEQARELVGVVERAPTWSPDWAQVLAGLADAVEQLQLELKSMTGNRDRGLLVHSQTLAKWSEDCAERDQARAEVDRLTDGIREHKTTRYGSSLQAWIEADERLWSLLDVAGDDSLGDRLAAKHGIGEKPDAREHIDFVTGGRMGDGGEVTHRCPPKGEGVMPCCGRTPFEVPRSERVTSQPGEVTCVAGDDSEPPPGYVRLSDYHVDGCEFNADDGWMCKPGCPTGEDVR